MKKKLLLVFCLCFLLLPLSLGNAEEGLKLDGYLWPNMPKLWRLGFVKGWTYGSGIAIDGIPFFVTAFNEKIIDRERYVKLIKGFGKEKGLLELDELSSAQIISTIDKIYSNPKVKQWEIHEVMPLVRGRLKEGWTERDLDDVIAYLIKEKELLKKAENYKSMGESERKKFEEEIKSLVEPKVLKALRAYRFE